MFYLETEFFVWNFLVWAANFLLGALVIFIAAGLWRKARNIVFVESGESVCGTRWLFITRFERYLRFLRAQTVDIWLGSTWFLVVAPLFLTALFTAAVFAR